jgi:hypothetical protein
MPKTNIAEFAVEQEAVPGTAETIVQADVLVKLREGYTVTPDHEVIDLLELKSVSSRTAAVIGRKTVTFAVTYIMRGPGDLTTDPAIKDLMEAALFDGEEALKEGVLAAITGGPYVAGEVITGTTSAATGLVLQETATGASDIPYIALSGTFQDAETITGGTSGATCTSSGTPAAAGYAFRPADWDTGAGYHATCKLIRHGFQWTGRGCLTDWSITCENGGPGIVTQNFVGALTSQGTQAVFGVTDFPEESVTVPRFLDASIAIGSYSPTGIQSVTINWPTNPTIVEDANDSAADGVLYADYRRDLPTITLDVDQVATATKDYFAELQAATTQRFEMTLGSAAGAIWTYSAPNAQLRSIGASERDPSRATFSVEFGCTGDNNEELLIWQH